MRWLLPWPFLLLYFFKYFSGIWPGVRSLCSLREHSDNVLQAGACSLETVSHAFSLGEHVSLVSSGGLASQKKQLLEPLLVSSVRIGWVRRRERSRFSEIRFGQSLDCSCFALFRFFLPIRSGGAPQAGKLRVVFLENFFSFSLLLSLVSCRGFRWSDPILGILAARPWNFSKPWMKVEVNKVRLVSCFSLFLSSRIAFM